MPNRAPRFSVVIPCFNQGAFLGECLESLAAQLHPAHEIIVVDDGSTDPWSRERVHDLCRDPVILVEQENRGLAGARNAGIRRATGDWIVPLDADDRLTPDALASYAQAIAREPQVAIWYPHIAHFGLDDLVWLEPEFNAWRQLTLNQLASSSAISRRVFDAGVAYNENLSLGYEDWELYIHACCDRGFLAKGIGKPVFLYRKWGYSMLSEADANSTGRVAEIRSQRPIFSDPDKLTALKRAWSPFFAIAAQGRGLEAALATQTFQDWRVVESTGRAAGDGDLSAFARGLGRYLLVSEADGGLARCLTADPFLLEKLARTCANRDPSVLWLTLQESGAAYPGFLRHGNENASEPCSAVAYAVSLRRLLEHPRVERRSASLAEDVAAHIDARAQDSQLCCIAGAVGDAEEGIPLPAGALVHSAGSALAPASDVPSSEPARELDSSRESPPAPASDASDSTEPVLALRERAHALGKSVSQLARALLGPRGHAALRTTPAFRALRGAVAREPEPTAEPTAPTGPGADVPQAAPAAPAEFRRSPVPLDLADRVTLSSTLWFVASEPPRFAPQQLTGRALLILAPYIVVGGADRAVVDLVAGLRSAAPDLRVYLATTLGQHMTWAPAILPHLSGVFSIADEAPGDPRQAIAQLVERLRVDTVLVTNSQLGYDALPAIRRLPRRVRTVAQLHTYVVDPGTGRPGAYPAYAASRYNNLIDAYAVISGSIGKRLTSQLYVSPTKIRTIPLGIDVERFARAGRGGRLGGEVAEVLWLGRLSEEKDPLMVVRIAEAWRERHSERRVRFTIVGGGPLEAELRRRAAASPAAGLVELVGPTRDPVPLYERADLLLMTSRFEGTPVVVFEAMAAGVPIIAAVANTEIAEVVSAEDAYLLPRQDDVAAYVDALVRATSAPEDARARAARARSRVRSVEQHAHEMLSLLFPEAPRHRPEPRAGFGDTV